MGMQSISSLDMVIRNLTDAELHDLLARVQTELLHRPGQRSGLAVEVVTEDEAALLAFYRGLRKPQRHELRQIASTWCLAQV